MLLSLIRTVFHSTMPLHILKLCVGIESVDGLRKVQASRLERDGAIMHYTRHRPKRAAEVLSGGSIYWIIRGFVQVRQRIISIKLADSSSAKRCILVLDQQLFLTDLQPRKPHQGWRYLNQHDAPLDSKGGVDANDELPKNLIAELRALGVW